MAQAARAIFLTVLLAGLLPIATQPAADLSYHRDNTISYIKAYNDGTNRPVWDEMTCSSPWGKFPPELQTIEYTDQCVARDYSGNTATGKRASLGVVVSACREQLKWLQQMGCVDKHIYVYSKCGRPMRHIMANIGAAKKCTTVIDATADVWDTLVNVKMHADYLKHVLDRYTQLEPRLLFLKGNLMMKKGQRHMNLDIRSMVQEAKYGDWAYKPLGSWRGKIGTHFDRNPFHTGAHQYAGSADESTWGRELCTLYKRYTCETECYTCHHCEAPVCFQTQSKGMFMVTADRVRSLPRSEYAWLWQWLRSWDGRGIQRRFMMDTVWSALFGCEEEAHRSKEAMMDDGCKADQGWGKLLPGSLVTPPEEFIRSGQVTWPVPPEVFAGQRLPLIPVVPTSATKLTFVAVAPVTMATIDSYRIMDGVTVAFLSALLSHPDANLVLLHTQGTAPQEHGQNFWAGKLQKLQLPAPPHWLWASYESYQLAMQIQLLKEIESNTEMSQLFSDSLVMIAPGAVIGRNLRPVFNSIGSAAGFVLTAPSGHKLTSDVPSGDVMDPVREERQSPTRIGVDSSLWLVPASGLSRSASELSNLWDKALASATGNSGDGGVLQAFSRQVARRIEYSFTMLKTSITRPALAGLACDMLAGRVGEIVTPTDEVCKLSKNSFSLHFTNSTQIPTVWSWMQSKASGSYAIYRAYHQLASHKRHIVTHKAYEHILLQTDLQ